jgi:hypothetical protein
MEIAIAVPDPHGGLMGQARQAWELALEQVNAAGGIRGRPLSVRERDLSLDTQDPSLMADGFVSLTREGYKYIISLVSGAALRPMMDAAMPRGVLTMSVTSEDSASELPEFDGMLLRAILPTDRLIQKQALALQGEGLLSIAIVGETVAGQQTARQLAMYEAYASCEACTTEAALGHPLLGGARGLHGPLLLRPRQRHGQPRRRDAGFEGARALPLS